MELTTKISSFILCLFGMLAIYLRAKRAKDKKEFYKDVERVREEYRNMDIDTAVKRSNERYRKKDDPKY